MTDLENIQGQTFDRFVTIDQANINEEKRLVELSFSSEEPVERFYGSEVLSHDPSAVRLSRLNGGGPVLVNHDMNDQPGVVERAYIGEDRKGRAVIRFGRSKRAEEVFQDIQDGIKRNVSVSYRVHTAEQIGMKDDLPILRITDWEPTEISIVSIPADPTVGVGRGAERSKPTMDSDYRENEFDKAREKGRASGEEAEQERAGEILAMAELFRSHNPEIQEVANRAVANGVDLEEFRREAISMISSKPISTRPAHLGLSDREVQKYSLFRALEAYASKDWSRAGFELECSRATTEIINKEPRGFYVPFDVTDRGQWTEEKRTLTVGTAGTGGYLKGTDHLAANFIDALREYSYVLERVTILPGLVGDVDIPGMDDATFYHLTEDQDVTDSTPATTQVLLQPTTVAGSVPVTRRLLKQSSPQIEGLLRMTLAAGIAVEMDGKIINGSGAAGQPTGILNQTGLNTSTITTPGQPTWAELVGFETALATDKALKGGLAYIMTPAIVEHCKTTLKTAAVAGYLMEDGQINGYPAFGTTNMPANGILYCEFAAVLVGLWGVLDVKADEATKAAAGGLVIRVFQDYDVGMRHAVSACKNA